MSFREHGKLYVPGVINNSALNGVSAYIGDRTIYAGANKITASNNTP